MLTLIGMGIHGYKGLSIEAIEAIKHSDKVYLEVYTSPISGRDMDAIRALRSDMVVVQRWFVEDGRRILDEARVGDVALLTYGDPLIATTHVELIVRAKSSGIRCKVIHSSSIVTAALGECGLHVYKLGRIATVVSDPIANTSTYYALYTNLLQMNHTLLLLEYDHEHGYFLAPCDALRLLLECESRERMNAIGEDAFAIVASRVGMEEDMMLVGGKIGSLLKHGFGEPPHTLIVTGSLHFTEVEALKASVTLLDEPIDNTKRVKARAEVMLSNYIPRAYTALSRARGYINAKDAIDASIKDMMDNAEYYLSDAERFAREHRYEHAILALGYAEGLIDALRYLKGIDPWRG
ncbi:MAG: diphthine synthase [Candidatus Nitrosocaldus sp.]